MFSVDEILEATGGRILFGKRIGSVKGVGIDSRTIRANELFIAIKGEKFDGHDFISQVEKSGVRFFIVHKPVKVSGSTVVLVNDTTKALGLLARYHRLRFNIPVIGVTGSAGKTTTKELITAVLKQKLNVLANEGTQNNHIGVPLTLLKLKKKHQALVVEMGTNQPGDIQWLTYVAEPTMAVLINIGESHLEKLKNLRGVFVEKMQLAKKISKQGYVLYNADDKYLKNMDKEGLSGRCVSFSVSSKSDYQARIAPVNQNNGICFTVNKKSYSLQSFSSHLTYNALAAIICGEFLGVPSSKIVGAIKQFKFSKGRQQIIRKNGMIVIDDTYNANPLSMQCAINALDARPVKGRRIFVCSDMLELGVQSKMLHAKIGLYVAQSKTNILMTVGDQSRIVSIAAQTNNPKLHIFHFTDVESLRNYLSVVCQKGDVILIKGSRRMKMENIVQGLIEDNN